MWGGEGEGGEVGVVGGAEEEDSFSVGEERKRRG